ncbi:MAG: BMC domain-containing protein [Ignavibacteria bacterium]|nr:BMC domain-containing protein [Ignavibacteria bacterium]
MEMAFGLIEIKGFAAVIAAADAMFKTADIKLMNKEYLSGGTVFLQIEGESVSVQYAIEAAEEAVKRMSIFVNTRIIINPAAVINSSTEKEKTISCEEEKEQDNQEKTKSKSETLILHEETESIDEKAIPQEKPEKEIEKEIEQGNPINSDAENSGEIIYKETEAVKDGSFSESYKKSVELPLKETERDTLFPEESSEEKLSISNIPPIEEMDNMNVHELRHLARITENFPIFGRDISKANRKELLDYFRTILK